MATKLGIYNDALRHCKSRPLASLLEDRKPRHILDSIWNEDFIKGCLEDGYWNFSLRTVAIQAEPAMDPTFGYKFAVLKPDDWIRTQAISADDSFFDPLTNYSDEGNYIFTNFEVFYLRFASLLPEYGMNMGIWPESFTDYCGAKLGLKACKSLTGSMALKDDIDKDMRKALLSAKSIDAMNEPPRFNPINSWNRARMRGRNLGSVNPGRRF